ncbi:MAG: LysR substrate-binding domain-containing protein [Pseudomonadota bacterium]
MVPITLRQLEYVCALADTLSFVDAADRCHVSQPTITAALQALEQQLGLTVFERDKRRVVPTYEGRSVIDYAREAVRRAEDLVQFAHSCADPTVGTLTVAAIPTIAPFCFAELLIRCERRFPTLHVSLREQETDTMVKALARGDVDIGLLALPADTAGLLTRHIGIDQIRLVAPSAHGVCQQSQVSLKGFDVDELVWLEEGHCLREQGIKACGIEQDIPEQLSVNNLLTLVQLVASGYGAALVPQLALDADLMAGMPVTQVETVEQPAREIVWACRASHPKVDFLLGALADALSSAVIGIHE